MVTKDYLDKKLGVLKGDLVTLNDNVDTKLCVFVEETVKEGSLKRKTVNSILAMEPLPDNAGAGNQSFDIFILKCNMNVCPS